MIERKDFHKLSMVWMLLYQTSSRKLKFQSLPGFYGGISSVTQHPEPNPYLGWQAEQRLRAGPLAGPLPGKLHSSCAIFLAFPTTMSVKENIMPGVTT